MRTITRPTPTPGRAGGALLPLVGADTMVPIVGGGRVRYANLDAAASTPALEAVAARVAEVLPHYASVHRGAGYLSQVSTALYESARSTIARFVDARPDDVCVITRNTTDGLNLLASVVPEEERVLVLDVEHHADLLPWTRRRSTTVLPAGTSVAETLEALRAALHDGAFGILAVTGASNVTGEALPLGEVVGLAHAAGTRLVVDGAQLVPHRRLPLASTGVDYVAFSGHKLYAPFGAGALVGRRDLLDTGRPYLAGGGAVRDVRVDRVAWNDAPARHEGGSPNVLGAIALGAASDALSALPEGRLDAHERDRREHLLAGLAEIPGVRVLRLWPDSVDPIGVVTFTVGDLDPGLVAAVLAAEHGIGVRDGRFCAHPLLRRLGAPRGAVRASIGVGTTTDDIDRLLAGLRVLLERGPRATYRPVDGTWSVVDDDRPLVDLPGLDRLAPTAACAPEDTMEQGEAPRGLEKGSGADTRI